MGIRKLKLMFLFLFLLTISCNRRGGGPDAEGVYVTVFKVEYAKMQQVLEASGTLQAHEEAKISSKIPGRIEKVVAEMGKHVVPGDVLLLLEKEELQAQRNIASAQQQEIHANVQEEEFNRQKKLFEKGVISESEFKKIESQFNQAQASEKKAQSLLDLREEELKSSIIMSPIDGVVAEVRGSRGENVGAGQPLIHVVNVDPIILKTEVSSQNLKDLELNQKVEISIKAYENEKFFGFVKNISPVVDPFSRTVKLEIEIANPDQRIKAGLFAQAKIHIKTLNQSLSLPKRAIFYKEKQAYVYVVEEKKAKEIPVQVGLEQDDKIQIVSGLKEGHVVVVSGHHKLAPGTVVRVREGG